MNPTMNGSHVTKSIMQFFKMPISGLRRWESITFVISSHSVPFVLKVRLICDVEL